MGGAVVGGGGGGEVLFVSSFRCRFCIPAFCVVSLQWQGKCEGASLF